MLIAYNQANGKLNIFGHALKLHSLILFVQNLFADKYQETRPQAQTVPLGTPSNKQRI